METSVRFGIAPTTSTFAYDADGHLTQATIADSRPRTIAYVDNFAGQVIGRTDSTGPVSHAYMFNGVQRGMITTNGPVGIAVRQALADGRHIRQIVQPGSDKAQ